ncbi:hypothetical protein BDA99DRAFT_604332 [Phascolomyces articulosus]|uniref:F-box domain-containing protein n=1 Tax=Phascolomyces articulosus TaxID=60185 RepID=A0AAD5K1R7_9FUNG|nr:hypothetical protein BDA99DRAFT_604332 [Phascolomyces articulosus]
MTESLVNPLANTINHGKDRSLDQLGLLSLPTDLILVIFTHLTRSDVLTSMAVSRSWYNNVPQYSQHLWTHLKLHKLKYYKNNHRWKRCLGDHVKNVIFDTIHEEHQILDVMNILYDNGCHAIKYLEFINCSVFSNEKYLFLQRLEQLTGQLLELKFIRHSTNLPFIRILEKCPQLNRFTFIPTGDAYKDFLYDTEPTIPDEQLRNEFALSQQQLVFQSLTYLCLDVYMHKQRLEWIVKKCPMLRHLICTTGLLGVHQGFSIIPDYNTNIIDLTMLFNHWCPNLTFLQSNCDCFTKYRQDWSECIEDDDRERKKGQRGIHGEGKTRLDNNEVAISHSQQLEYRQGSNGLRYLYTCEAQNYGPSEISPYVIQHADTLESLLLHGRYYHSTLDAAREDWSPIFDELVLPQIRRLECCGILINTSSLTLLLDRSPSLEKLAIDIKDLNLHLSRTLKGLSQLTHLYLSNTNLVFDIIGGDSSINGTTYHHDDSNVSTQLFEDLARHGSKLQVIEFDSMPRPASDQLLQAMAHLYTLKMLRIEINGDLLSDQGFTRFAELLAQNTAIEFLELRYISYASRSTLEALARLQHLKTLRLLSPRGVGMPFYADGTGLSRLLRRSISLKDMFFDSIRLFDPPDSIKSMLKRQVLKYELKDVGDYFVDFMQVENYVTLGRIDGDHNRIAATTTESPPTIAAGLVE